MADTNLTLSLEDARAITRRGVEKTEDFGQRSAFVVVDDQGILITASRMDGATPLSYVVARAKAHQSAVMRAPTGLLYELFKSDFGGIFAAFQRLVREDIFTGPGAQLILKDGRLVGALSTGLGIPPFAKFPGVDPMKLVVDGKPANGEDLTIAYALQRPYLPQHGDDMKRWIDAYGQPPEGQGVGFAEAPKAVKQPGLDAAISMCDAAMAEAKRRNAFVSIAVVDQAASVVHIDRMENAAPMTPDSATALAVTAVNFRAPSADAAKYPSLEALANVTSFKYLPAPGGLPIMKDGRLTGAIGVSGTDPEECEAIARVAIGS